MALQILKAKQLGAKLLADNCGQSYDKVMEDFDRDYWMDAKDSKKYGIIDDIINKL
jgi:ATP-dependent Clp protease protease subunit